MRREKQRFSFSLANQNPANLDLPAKLAHTGSDLINVLDWRISMVTKEAPAKAAPKGKTEEKTKRKTRSAGS